MPIKSIQIVSKYGRLVVERITFDDNSSLDVVQCEGNLYTLGRGDCNKIAGWISIQELERNWSSIHDEYFNKESLTKVS